VPDAVGRTALTALGPIPACSTDAEDHFEEHAMTSTYDVPASTMRRIVELATRAPSVHNTQPWRWRATGHVLELFADRRHQLHEADPSGRNLTISCGAALHHARVGAAALGWAPHVARHPDPSQPDLLASLVLSPDAPPAGAEEDLEAIARRCTDRRRFTSWPVPEERLSRLSRTASDAGTRAVPLTDVSERFRAERLVHRAAELQRSQPATVAELRAWRDRAGADGVPSSVVPAHSSPAGQSHRFGAGFLEDLGDRQIEGSDGLIAVFDTTDDAAAWLRAGEGLSAMWLAATAGGLSLVPLSQVIEVTETRDAVRLEVLGGLAHPLVLARVGWQAIGRSELTRTRRRPVSEVLDLA
jgi:hypothetical protein